MKGLFVGERGRILLIGAALVIVATGAWLTAQNKTPEPLTVQAGDSISHWNWKGSFQDGGTLEQKTRTEIARLESLIGTGEFPDYQLYVGIAQHYELLGEGERVYEFLNKALALDSSATGLAWHNLGFLFTRLGAYNTARIAYARAVEAQPDAMQYHVARLTFLSEHFPQDRAAIEGALAEAYQQFGDSAQVLQVKANWQAATGDSAGAIATWKKILPLVPAVMQDSIEDEIARLSAKL